METKGAGYVEISTDPFPGGDEVWSLYCFERGAIGVEVTGDGRILAWFEAAAAPDPGDLLSGFARSYPHALAPGRVTARGEEARDWEAEARAGFAPLPLGAGFVICPPWAPALPPEYAGRRVLIVDPGQAFGTGRHISTVLALEALEGYLLGLPSPPARVADVGAGSGILGMVAAALGVPEVWTADTDPVTGPEICANFERSGLSPPRVLVPGTASDLPPGFPLVVANIRGEILLAIAPDLARAAAPGGAVILSGIRDEEEPSVRSAGEAADLDVVAGAGREGWRSIQFRRRT